MPYQQNPWHITLDSENGKWTDADSKNDMYSRAVCSTRDPGQDVCVQWTPPTFSPTAFPTVNPSECPSSSPSKTPTKFPSASPTKATVVTTDPVTPVTTDTGKKDKKKKVKQYDDLEIAGASTIGGVTQEEATEAITDALVASLSLPNADAVEIISITKVVARRRLADPVGDELGSWIIEWVVTAETVEAVEAMAVVIKEDTFVETVKAAVAEALPERTITFTQAPIIIGLEQEDEGGKLSTAVIVVIALVGGSLFICGVLWGIYKFLCGKSAPGTVAPPSSA